MRVTGRQRAPRGMGRVWLEGTVAAAVTAALLVGVQSPALAAGAYDGCGVIMEGRSGDCVTELQNDLNDVNADYGLPVTGFYGPATRTAVLDFQGRNDLPADGEAGQQVQDALTDQATSDGAVSSPEPRGGAAAAPGDPTLRDQADTIMNMKYLDFIAFKADERPEPFNWSDDGCSGPAQVKPIYRDLFNRPCQMHDFGYRNYGRHDGGLQLGPNEGTRAWIDKRLLTEMSRLCDRNIDLLSDGYNLAACKVEANAVYRAVRDSRKGHDAFYSA